MNVTVKEKLQNQKGFTIIEVVLVLAIAGLIFLMVFIALPALQSSQRDTARKNDISTVSAAVTQYTGNNKGAYPAATTSWTYVKNYSNNTTSLIVKAPITSATLDTTTDGTITVWPKAICDSSTSTGVKQGLKAGTTRNFAVVTQLEAGGGTPYCQDNS